MHVHVLRAWGLRVFWNAVREPEPVLTVTAETVRPVYRSIVVRHLHLTPGGDAAGFGQLPPGSAATAREGE